MSLRRHFPHSGMANGGVVCGSCCEVSDDREVQRTMLELLNQLYSFSSDDRIKVIAATNRSDILDPALMRSDRLDSKIESLHPTEEARTRILQIHLTKMNVNPDVNFEELARSTDDFNGARLKVICVEAGMLALRCDATKVPNATGMGYSKTREVSEP